MPRFGLLVVLLAMAACKSEPESVRPAPGASSRSLPSSAPAVRSSEPRVGVSASEAPAPRAPDLGEASGSCNWISIVSSCTESVGDTPKAREKALRALAQFCKSVPQKKPCPEEHRIGSCRTPDGFIEHYYASGARPHTAEEAKAECENREGRWLG